MWQIGGATKLSPQADEFLDAMASSGFLAFIHEHGLFGAKAGKRSVAIVHRGRGARWEIAFREHDVDIITTVTTELAESVHVVRDWLHGASLVADENSIHPLAG